MKFKTAFVFEGQFNMHALYDLLVQGSNATMSVIMTRGIPVCSGPAIRARADVTTGGGHSSRTVGWQLINRLYKFHVLL